jgi:NAD(P)-dependent dehydrogenase (short-subunit alcohol dehydrogenase family)
MERNETIHELFNLTGKVFIVAGGARDLGRDMAFALAEAGANGIITSRNKSSAQKTALEIGKKTGGKVTGLALDAAIEENVVEVIRNTLKKFRRIDVLVNCVGGGASAGSSSRLEERRLEDWESLHRTNVNSIFLLCKHVVPIMKQQRAGSIINIASIAAITGRDRRVYPEGMSAQSIDYASAKSAVVGLTRDLAAYLGPDGIRVNAISPGGFERGQPESFIESYSDKTPLRRMGRDGTDIKGAVLFLAAESSAYVTGHNLVVDGGFTICH